MSMTNTQTHIIPTATHDLKGGDFIQVSGETLEVFDTVCYTGRKWATEVIDADGSVLLLTGESFNRVVR